MITLPMRTLVPVGILLCGVLGFAAVSASAQERSSPPERSGADAQSSLSVFDAGAKGDGQTDDTPAFQRALDQMGSRPRGGTVYVPRASFLLAGHLVIPSNVALEGVWTIPTAWTETKGSTLLAVEGEGKPDGPPFITLHTNSVLKGLTIFYPNQVASAPPKAYPWTIAAGGGDNSSIVDCLLVNPYQAVDFGTHPSGRHYIRNLYGYPLYKGLYVDQCYDIGRVENVHFWPFWNPGDQKKLEEVQAWVAQNGTSFIFARTDWEYVTNTFSWGYRVGYHFTKSKAGSANGNFLGIGADATNIAVLVDECAPYGLLITNGEFVAMNGDNPVALVVKDTNTGVVQWQNCAVWGTPWRVASIRGIGTVMFNNCNFVSWDPQGKGLPAIEAFGGQVIVNACNFVRPGPQVVLGKEVQSAVITSNRFAGPPQIVNQSDGDVQIGLNASGRPPKEEASAIVVDDGQGAPAFTTEGPWYTGVGGGDYLGMTHWAYTGTGDSKACWRPTVPKAGTYRVYVYYGNDPIDDHATNAPHTVHHAKGTNDVVLNLKQQNRQWHLLGEFPFEQGTGGCVTASNNANGHVVADAVKFVPVE